MRTIKKLLPIIFIISLLLSLFSIQSYAVNGSSIAFSKQKPTIGETFTVTARFNTPGYPMYGLEAFITYDPKILEFVSADTGVSNTPGQVQIAVAPTGKVNYVENIKFKAIKTGSATVSAERITFVSDSEDYIPSSSAQISIIDTSAAASSNANLKTLFVSAGTLTPKFSPNVTSYNVTIPYEEDELWLNLTLDDANATYKVEGSKDMKVGNNRRTVIVTAQNGATKSYVVNITRLDNQGNAPEIEDPNEDPLTNAKEIVVNDVTMYVDENFTTDMIPAGFELTEYALNGENVPAISDGNCIMLYLFTPDGSKKGFYVISKEDTYIELTTVVVGGSEYYILPTEKIPVGYTLAEGNAIGDVEVVSYVSDDAALADFFLVYAKGPGGYTGFYRYDLLDQNIQRVVDIEMAAVGTTAPQKEEQVQGNVLNNFNKLSLSGKIVACSILGAILLLIVAVIVLIVKIATSGEKKEKREESISDEDSVGFEYISVSDDVAPPVVPAEDIEINLDAITEATITEPTFVPVDKTLETPTPPETSDVSDDLEEESDPDEETKE